MNFAKNSLTALCVFACYGPILQHCCMDKDLFANANVWRCVDMREYFSESAAGVHEFCNEITNCSVCMGVVRADIQGFVQRVQCTNVGRYYNVIVLVREYMLPFTNYSVEIMQRVCAEKYSYVFPLL